MQVVHMKKLKKKKKAKKNQKKRALLCKSKLRAFSQNEEKDWNEELSKYETL